MIVAIVVLRPVDDRFESLATLVAELPSQGYVLPFVCFSDFFRCVHPIYI